MSTCSSRISDRRRSSGPENDVSSTTKVDSVGGVYVSGEKATVTREMVSTTPLTQGLERKRIRPTPQQLAKRERGRHPCIQRAAARQQKEKENDDSDRADALIVRRPLRRQHVFQAVRTVEWRNRNEVKRQEQQVELHRHEHHRLNK